MRLLNHYGRIAEVKRNQYVGSSPATPARFVLVRKNNLGVRSRKERNRKAEVLLGGGEE